MSEQDERDSEEVDEEYRTNLSLYDESLRDRLLEVFDNVVIAPPEKAFNRSAVKGKVQLPMISAYRMTNEIDLDEYNNFETFYGVRGSFNKQRDTYALIQGLPITIMYQIDIWAQLRAYADGIFRELVYHLVRYPNLVIKVPGFDEAQVFALQYEDMDQPTDYSSFTDTDQLHRYTLNYKVPRARLFYGTESAKIARTWPVALRFLEQLPTIKPKKS